MKVSYDKYYKSENLFGDPYPELIHFFANYPKPGKLLDLGCGQGRDAIPLARLGFEVTGIDNSIVGISQMNKVALEEGLSLKGVIADIYQFNQFRDFEFILLDSMFHFSKKDVVKESKYIHRMVKEVLPETHIIFCIQNTGSKVKVLSEAIDFQGELERVFERDFDYEFRAQQSGHSSKTAYRMMVVKK